MKKTYFSIFRGSLKRLTWLSRVVDEAKLSHFVASLLDHLHDGVVQGILVLLQPPSQVVGHHGGVVDNTKVSVGVTGLEVGLAEVGVLPEESVVQLGTVGLVCCLGEHGLLLQNGHQSHGLFHTLNGRL